MIVIHNFEQCRRMGSVSICRFLVTADKAPYNPILNKRVISDNLCLKIDFGNYDDDRARELINSKTELSLLLASKFLKKDTQQRT